jgi:LPS-assembly protein
VLRSIAAAASLASLGLGFAAIAQTALFAGPPGGEVEVEADRLIYSWEPQVVHLQGHVVARRAGGLVRAGSGTLDRAKGILKLEGGVLGVQGRQVFLADAAIVDLNARTAELTKAVLFLKAGAANPDAPRSGANALTLHGARVRQFSAGRYLAEQVTLTPCDCVGEPDYELIADTAEIEGDRARLRKVNLRLLGATLPFFPLSLPLTNRESGLLAPQIGFGAPIGFTYAQPIFLTLGPSYDVTVAPGWYTGGHAHQQAPGQRSIKGPRLGLEGRYAPAEGTAGSLALDLFHDLDQHDGSSPGRGFGGVRGIGRIGHRTQAGAGVLAIQGIAATDVMAVRDQAAQSIENSLDLLATDVGFWRARGPLTFGADATLMQDMRIGPPAIDRKLFGRGAGTTFHRLPAIFAQLAPIPLGGATFSLEASAVQFARFGGPDERERETGFGWTDRVTGTPAPSADAWRAPALRLDLSPRLALAGPRSLPVDLRLEAGARVDGWLLEGYSERDRARAYAILGARAALPLERRYGGALHRVEPAFELRALSKSLQAGGPPIGDLTDGGGPAFEARPDAAQQGLAPTADIAGVPAARRAYDEVDFAAPVTGTIQATASLSQSVWTKPGRNPGRIFRFDLLQDALLWAAGAKARLGEASAVAGVQLGPGSAQGSVRYDWALRELSAFGASAGVRDARGHEIHAAVGMLRGSSSERLRAGIDELFSTARFAAAPTALTGSARAGGSAKLPLGLRLAYDVAFTPGDTPADFANWSHVAALTYETPCRCAGLQVVMSVPLHDTRLLRAPDFSFRIDLKSLGSFATF